MANRVAATSLRYSLLATRYSLFPTRYSLFVPRRDQRAIFGGQRGDQLIALEFAEAVIAELDPAGLRRFVPMDSVDPTGRRQLVHAVEVARDAVDVDLAVTGNDCQAHLSSLSASSDWRITSSRRMANSELAFAKASAGCD